MGRRRTTAVAMLVAGAVAGLTLVSGAGAAAPTVLQAQLAGKNEVPKAGTGTGFAKLTINASTGRVCFNITLKGVGVVAAGHIHKGGSSKAGPVVIPLFAKPTAHPKGCVKGQDKSALSAILKKPGSYYVNVHSAKYPDGAARGQLTK